MYELVIFDWDGTLMDSTARIVDCLQKSAVAAGLDEPVADQARQIIGLGMQEGFEQLFPDASQAQAEAMIAHYRDEFVHRNRTSHQLYPGVMDWLAGKVSGRLLLAVATGKSRAGLDREIAVHGMGAFFVASRCADECFSKPHPQMVLELLDETGIEADHAIMVGDTSFDMEMARAADVDCLGLSQGAHTEEQLRRSGASVIVESFTQAAQWLDQRTIS